MYTLICKWKYKCTSQGKSQTVDVHLLQNLLLQFWSVKPLISETCQWCNIVLKSVDTKLDKHFFSKIDK